MANVGRGGIDFGGGGIPSIPRLSGAGKGILLIGAGIVAFLLILSGVTSIPTGNVGVLTLFGKVTGEALSEGIHFARKSGLDVNAVIETISKGAAQSWQMENRYKTMNDGKFDFGFAVDWMRKDLSMCLTEARRNGANLPVTALIDQFYSEVQKMGGRRWDTSSLIARLER